MAEYYPLLARAVASLPDSTPDVRRAVYERARKALIGQLRATQPPVPEADIERESKALDEAIARVEGEQAARVAIAPPRPASAGLPAAAPARPPVAPPVAIKPPVTPPRAPEALGNGSAPTASPGRPTIPPPPPPPNFRPAPPRPPAPGPLGAETAWPPSPKLTLPVALSGTPAVAAAAPVAPVAVAAPQVEAEPAGAEPPPMETSVATIKAKAPFWRRFGRSRSDAEGPARSAPQAIFVGEAMAPTGARPFEPPAEPVRPPAPVADVPRQSSARGIVGLLALALVVAGVGTLAYRWKDNPADFAAVRQQPTAETTDPASGPKIVERIGGGRAAPAPAPAPATGEAGGRPAPAPSASSQPPAPAQAALPIGQRAALLVEAPEEPQRVKTWYGTVVWKLEPAVGDGPPALRADVDIPDARLQATLTITRNSDPKSVSSHFISIRFTPGAESVVPGVAEIETPSMRIEDRPVGDALEGRTFSVTSNVFLVGLMRNDTLTARNIDLLRTRGWIDVPMRLSSGKIAKITFEKGGAGDRLLTAALEAWQK